MTLRSILARAAEDGMADQSFAHALSPAAARQFILETVDTCMIGRRLHVWVNEAPAFEAFAEGRGFARITRLNGHDAHQGLVDVALQGQEAALSALLDSVAREAERLRIDQTALPSEAAGLYGCVRAKSLMQPAQTSDQDDLTDSLIAAFHPDHGWRSQSESHDTLTAINWADAQMLRSEQMTRILAEEDVLMLSGPGGTALALVSNGCAVLLKGPQIARYAQSRAALLACFSDA